MARRRSSGLQVSARRMATRRAAAPLISPAVRLQSPGGARTRSGAARPAARRSSRLYAGSAASTGSGSQQNPTAQVQATPRHRAPVVRQRNSTAQRQAMAIPGPAFPLPGPAMTPSRQQPLVRQQNAMLPSQGPVIPFQGLAMTPRRQSPIVRRAPTPPPRHRRRRIVVPRRQGRDPRLDGRHQYRCPECGFHARLRYFPAVWAPGNEPGSSSEGEEDPVDVDFIRQVDMQLRAARQAAFVMLENN